MASRWQQWMPLRIDAFKSSPAVQAMHPAARAGYLYLLTCQWQSDDCSISNDPLDLAEMSGLGDELWQIHSTRILRKFETVTVRSPYENDTVTVKLQNSACLLEWEKAKKVVQARQKAALDTVTVRSPYGHHQKNERSPDTITITGTSTSTTTTTEKAKTTPRQARLFVLPDWLPADLWESFEEVRRKIRAPMTDDARRGIVAKLDKFREQGMDPVEILSNSRDNAWRGVFAPNTRGNSNGSGKQIENTVADFVRHEAEAGSHR